MTTIGGRRTALEFANRDEFIPDPSFFRGCDGPVGRSGLVLTVGGISVLIGGLDEARLRSVLLRHGAFCGEPGAGKTDATVEIVKAGVGSFLKPGLVQGATEYYRVDMRWYGSTLVATSYEWAGWFDATLGHGGLALGASALIDSKAFDRSMENYLRVLYAHRIVRHGGFLLHSAGLVRDDRAYLFFGPSGAGKTTVTSLSPEALVLSDDLTMVVKASDGEYKACSVPFRGLFAPLVESVREYPLAGFFRLVQDSSDSLEPLEGAAAVGEVLASLPFVLERPEIAGDVIDTVAGATLRVPVFKLRFRKDRTFWNVIGSRIDGLGVGRGIKS